MSNLLQLVECPRDAMQGIHDFIPTDTKVTYINTLLQCGFHTLDCGSFVSPKAIPQMQDTAEVLDRLDASPTKLSVIVANVRGAQDAVLHQRVDLLGFPFSVSETFQHRNTNSSMEESLDRVKEIKDLCTKHNKGLIIYLSMAFGNPYGDKWHEGIVAEWAHKLAHVGADVLMPSDTIGTSTPQSISAVFQTLDGEFTTTTIGAHLHTTPDTWEPKLRAAYDSGVRRFDSAIKGFGGCPMAKDELTGNMPTERVLEFLKDRHIATGIDNTRFAEAMLLAGVTFPI
jgi:hydroxymethylglutaryl-CoA lyase